jgi:hypothetical protein
MRPACARAATRVYALHDRVTVRSKAVEDHRLMMSAAIVASRMIRERVVRVPRGPIRRPPRTFGREGPVVSAGLALSSFRPERSI